MLFLEKGTLGRKGLIKRFEKEKVKKGNCDRKVTYTQKEKILNVLK